MAPGRLENGAEGLAGAGGAKMAAEMRARRLRTGEFLFFVLAGNIPCTASISGGLRARVAGHCCASRVRSGGG